MYTIGFHIIMFVNMLSHNSKLTLVARIVSVLSSVTAWKSNRLHLDR